MFSRTCSGFFLFMTFEERLYKKFGDTCKLVEYCKDIKDRAIISDGEYEYIVTTKRILDFKKFHVSVMTYESKIKRLNKECCNGVKIIKIETKNGTLIGHFEHTETKLIEKRNIVFSKIKKTCIDVSKRCMAEYNFIKKAKEKYKSLILYDKTIYTRAKKTSIFTCSIHGDFSLTPYKLMQNKYGCPKCGNENRPAYTKKSFIEKCAYNIGYIYIIECYSQTEKFIKIGITTNANLKNRFPRKASMPYEYNTIMIIGYNPSSIFDFEIEAHRNFNKHRYKPLIPFNGHTECFDIKIKDEAICFIQELLLNCTQKK